MRTKRALAILALLVGAVAFVPVVVAVAKPEVFLTVDGDDLADSLERVDGDLAVPEACERTAGQRHWKCGVEHDPGSGLSGYYVVTLSSETCWYARSTEAEREERTTRSGCVNFLDFFSP